MSVKITILKTAEKILGNLLSKVARKLVCPRTKGIYVNKILLIRPGGMGDAVLLLPSIRALKKNYPDSEIYVLAEKRNAGIFRICDEIKELFLYDDFRKLDLMRVFKNRYDIVIDTEQWHKLSSVTGFLTRAPVRIGFDTNARSELFTNAVKYSQRDYEAKSFLNLVNEINPHKAEFDPDSSFLKVDGVTGVDRKKFDEIKGMDNEIVGLFYGATVDERKWGISNYAELSNRLIEEKIGVLLLGGKSDLPELDDFLDKISNKNMLISFVGKTDLKQTAGIISKTDLFISGDSGLMHLAYGCGTKTLSLFGAGIEEKWGPKGKNSFIINKQLFCSPCTKFGYTPKCPYGVKCLSDISVDEVFNRALEILKT